MSERSGEVTRIRELLRFGGKKPSVFFVSPPLNTGEMNALTDTDPEKFGETADLNDRKVDALKALQGAGIIPKLTLVSENATIAGEHGSLVIYDREEDDSSIEAMAHLGKAVSALREQNDFAVSTQPGIED